MKAIRNPMDFWAGLIFIGIGILFLVLSRKLEFGTPLRMGPSFFPVVLATVLTVIGCITVVRSLLSAGEKLEGFSIRGLLAITIGGILFGLLVRGAGLVAAITVLTFVTAAASQKFKLSLALTMAAALSAFCAIVFVYGLGVSIPILGPWLGGE